MRAGRNRRYLRTLILALLALAALVWMATVQFDIAPAEIGGYVLMSLLVVGLVILAAALSTGVWVLLKRWRRERERDGG